MAIETHVTDYRTTGTWRRVVNGGANPGATGVVTCGWDYSSRTGEYRRPKPKARFIAPTAYSASFRTGEWFACRGAYTRAKSGSNTFEYFGALNFNNQWSNIVMVSSDTVTENRAIINARSRVKDSKVNLAVAFAERKQTANLFYDAARKVAAAIDAAKSLNPKAIKKAFGLPTRLTKKERQTLKRFGRSPKGQKDYADAAASLWLANAYGVKPLLSDVKGAAEALAKNDTEFPKRYRMVVRGRATTIARPSSDQTAALPSGGTGYINRNHTATVSCSIRLDCFLANPALAQAAALGLTNPLEVAWEKLPWSFVIDWLLPVGDYLNTMDATLGWELESGSKSSRVEGVVSQYMTVYNNGGYTNVSVIAAGTYGYGTLVRTPLGAFPFPSKILPKNPLSTGHVANALALLRSRFH